MLLTLYAHRNNPIFLPRFVLRHLHPLPYRFATPPSRTSPHSPAADPPSVIYFHLFRPSDPALISFGLVASCEATDLAVYFIIALNNFVLSPQRTSRCCTRRSWRHAIVIDHNHRKTILSYNEILNEYWMNIEITRVVKFNRLTFTCFGKKICKCTFVRITERKCLKISRNVFFFEIYIIW